MQRFLKALEFQDDGQGLKASWFWEPSLNLINKGKNMGKDDMRACVCVCVCASEHGNLCILREGQVVREKRKEKERQSQRGRERERERERGKK